MRTDLANTASFWWPMQGDVLTWALLLTFRSLVIGDSPLSQVAAPGASNNSTNTDASDSGRPVVTHDRDAQGEAREGDRPTDLSACGDSAHATTAGARRRGSLPNKKLKDYVPKPKGAPGGPLRTPLHIGDSWQHRESYQVEKVSWWLVTWERLAFRPDTRN